MSQKLPVGSFKWLKNVSLIDEEFIKNYDNDSDIRFILKVDNNILKNCMICIVTFLFCLRE